MRFLVVCVILLVFTLVDGGVVRQSVNPESVSSTVLHEIINQQTAHAMYAINNQLMAHLFPYTNLHYPYYPPFHRMTQRPLAFVRDGNNSTVSPTICMQGGSCYDYHSVHPFGEVWLQKPLL
ncbi:uncharacterized protein LOC130691623 [Daphnia carinata]|uniref:uncharacterized protein LOC130691623 n=1 Tax=Daphnia carinata TaxID=120202 RepID=UPI00257DF238|nr:uncharacterized protein LOC130691623 [Daphnia carinata]